MTRASPLVAVVGSTGTGKSRLSIELASAVRDGLGCIGDSWKGSKVINADCMQVYKGLNLATNKVTRSEMNGIEHALFDFREPDQEYVTTEWVNDATVEIDRAHRKSNLPFVVGGSTYWLQHLLFANRLASLEHLTSGPSTALPIGTLLLDLPPSLRQLFENPPPHSDVIDEATAFDIHAILSHLDPSTAARWHWKDTKNVLRSLKIIRESHRTVQDAYGAQPEPVARYPTMIFWLYMDPDDLNPILDARVDKMVQLGLKDEIEMMRNAISDTKNESQIIGLNQAIGYKEFKAYLDDPSRPQEQFDRGVEEMKAATRHYATGQVKWLESRLLRRAVASENVHIVLLHIKDVANWQTDILEPSLEYLKDFLNGRLPLEVEQNILLQKFIQESQLSSPSERKKISYDICTSDPRIPVLLDEKTEWGIHKKSRAHRRKESTESRKETQLGRQEEIRLPGVNLKNTIDSHH
ncbi:unnamed protein product [Rhizoctonia solani]|uniref:tRNA dimethylallyltransferase n=1 Tax=Rhizoctonia solani TaxID=456999 RepID=A0A8H3HCE7_9AGAM|nr:unnamed protein product [Rhizoctonia solani]